MITSSRILLGTIVAFVIVVLGVAVGFQIKQKIDSAPSTSPVTRETLRADIPANHNTYEISPPSRGVMLDTFPVNIVPEGAAANVTLPSREASDIKTGQKVFLYREDGVLLDTLGEVTAITKASDTITARIDLSHNPEISPTRIAKGKIILNREKDVPRLPYSALLRNEKAENHIWEVVENSDGTHTAYYKRADVVGGNDVVFAINPGMTSSNVFILNPDGELRDGQKINVREYMYKPPSQNEDLRIMAHVARRNSEYKSAEMGRANTARNAAARAAAAGTPQMGMGSGMAAAGPGCPQPQSTTQSFIDKIKVLSAEEAKKAAVPSP